MEALDHTARRSGKPTKAAIVAAQLRTDILNGSLSPGEKINLKQLREELGVSVSLIREAVTRLVADGLVETQEQRGYTVEPISIGNLAEITLLRMQLEPLTLRHAIARGDLDWEADVMGALHRLGRIERKPGDPASAEAWEQAHDTFHHALIGCCGMPLLLRVTAMLHNMNDRYRRIVLRSLPGQRDVSGEHQAIAEASVARRSDEAAALLRQHLERMGATLCERLTEQLAEDRA